MTTDDRTALISTVELISADLSTVADLLKRILKEGNAKVAPATEPTAAENDPAAKPAESKASMSATKTVADTASETGSAAATPQTAEPATAPAAETEAETDKAPDKRCTYEEARAILAEKARTGFRAEVKAILSRHGLNQLSEVQDPKLFAEIIKEAEAI